MPLKMSRKTMLAVEAVLDIAYFGAGDPVQAREIAKRQGVPPRFLEPVMQQLVHTGVLTGVRGPRGGYSLAKDGNVITVGEIVQVVSEMGGTEEIGARSELRDKVVQPFWDGMVSEFLERLREKTIADLCGDAEEGGVDRRRPLP